METSNASTLVALIECLELRPGDPGEDCLWGCHIDYPTRGSLAEGAALELRGWVVGRRAPATAVEILHHGRVIRRVPVDISRDDVARVYPQAPAAVLSGFGTTLQLRPDEGQQLDVRAVLADHTRVRIATLDLRTRWREDEEWPRPLVSVIIPCYRQAHYLAEAIESVLGQRYPHVEIVVVDDGSPDNTAEVAARYPGVRYVRQQNAGVSEARNLGIRSSSGSFLMFLDADDWLLPQAVDASLACFARHPNVAFVSGRFRFVAADGTTLYEMQGHAVDRDHYQEMLRRNYVAALCTAMFRRSVFESVTGFSRDFSICADYELYLRVLREFPAATHDTEVAAYRRHGLGISMHAERLLREALAALRAQRRHLGGDRARVAAYRSGIRFWRAIAADTIARQIRADWLNGYRASALRGVFRLRHCGWESLESLTRRGHTGARS